MKHSNHNSEAAKNRMLKALRSIGKDETIGTPTKPTLSDFNRYPKPKLPEILKPRPRELKMSNKRTEVLEDFFGNRRYLKRDSSNFDKLIRAACARIHASRKENEYFLPEEQINKIEAAIKELIEVADYLANRAKGIE